MALELKIYNPADSSGYLQEIKWNHEELKAAVAEKVEDYKHLVYSDEQIGEAKKDKTQLNKFKAALENKRKEIKAEVNKPYDTFAGQVKEITGIIDEAVANIDKQVRAFDDREKDQKKEDIGKIFKASGFPDFVSLEQIWNARWLNKTYSLKDVRSDLNDQKIRINNEIATLYALPAFSEEALIIYRDSLNLTQAISEAKRLTDIHNKAEERRKEQEQRKAAENARTAAEPKINGADAKREAEPEETATFTVMVTAKKSQYAILNDLFGNLKRNGITVKVTNKEVRTW